eukprot:TRINITY_DN4017_c0_g3_i1.p1 TRINITY_DN4017_c0_g3~~TRINITY_DN4017_c0_g3_i1.p1  ORF type:complete len:226 (-),score=47.84 TRINITY_DN4017_c0_g3_i1:107-784(-)
MPRRGMSRRLFAMLLAAVGTCVVLCSACFGSAFAAFGSSSTQQSLNRVRPARSQQQPPQGHEQEANTAFGTVALAGSAALVAAATAVSAIRRQPAEDAAVTRHAYGKLPVRQWEPEKIPASKRRAPEDRVRIKMWAHEPTPIMECVEVLEDFAAEQGGETEGPFIQQMRRKTYHMKKSPNGHKKAMTHLHIDEHCWWVDYYPPVEGNLDSLVKLRIPHAVYLTIE